MIRVFLACDDAIFSGSLHDYLQAQGDFSVCGETTSGVEAIAEAIGRRADLVVLEMSVEEDLEVAKMFGLRAPELPVFLVAGRLNLETEKKALSCRVRAVFLKQDDLSAIVLNARTICA